MRLTQRAKFTLPNDKRSFVTFVTDRGINDLCSVTAADNCCDNAAGCAAKAKALAFLKLCLCWGLHRPFPALSRCKMISGQAAALEKKLPQLLEMLTRMGLAFCLICWKAHGRFLYAHMRPWASELRILLWASSLASPRQAMKTS